MRWDIVTFSLGYGIVQETDFDYFRNIGFPDCEDLLVVNDASEDVGSGGSTLNALIRTAERLCFRNKLTVLSEAVLHDVNVLIVLVSDKRAIFNREKFINGGNGFILESYLTHAVTNATKIAETSQQKGVWIIGSDSFWTLNSQPSMLNLPQDSITGFTFYSDRDLFQEHGFYRTNMNGDLVGMEFNGSVAGLGQYNSGQMILGFLYLPNDIATAFLSLHSEFPVAATTYLGVDSNVTPLKLSLFFDFMLATLVSEKNFVPNKLGVHVKVSENVFDRHMARKQIYRKIGGFKGRIESLDISNFQYKQFPTATRKHSDLCYVKADPARWIRSRLNCSSALSIGRTDAVLDVLKELKENFESWNPDYLQVMFDYSLCLIIAAEGKGGFMSGPTRNPEFQGLLEIKNKKTCLRKLYDLISKDWIGNPGKMIRAARHLETGAQKFIRDMVQEMCVSKSIELSKSDNPSQSKVLVTAPIRIDFFGGWLDTPPIFFSIKNAAVINMAAQLDGKNPISCTVTKLKAEFLEIIQDDSRVVFDDNDLMYAHDRPSEPGALVCACIVALGYRNLKQFFEVLQCTGLRIETKSDLPHGSGLGTSSIMACTILKAICALGRVSEEKYTLEDQIVHTVLKVEQLMTTGGGWQDQCGAMYPGLKKCYYVKGDGVLHEPIPLSPAVKDLLEQRLLLVYTGKTRLAKNLLQEVIRNSFTCFETKKKLKDMADRVEEFGKRIMEGDVAVELLEQYHTTKNFMTRCEPPVVTELLRELKSHGMIDVGWAAGAGGGGFLYLYLSSSTSPSIVEPFITSKFPLMTCHRITIPMVPPVTLDLL